VFKPITSSLIALAVAATLAGCAKKEEAAAPAAAAAPEATTPTMPAGETHPAPKAAAEVDLTGIAKAEGGKTVAEVFAEKDALAGKPVTVRGKVVKTNADIMGKNWLHVRDGSGAEGTNDLTITTAPGTMPNVGDTVLVTGNVSLNKDFGMGYTYDVLVEDAQMTVEPAAQ
jgi:type IV pilus biogenesis protein CpaD/CtpE